jgi:hypothetical protein
MSTRHDRTFVSIAVSFRIQVDTMTCSGERVLNHFGQRNQWLIVPSVPNSGFGAGLSQCFDRPTGIGWLSFGNIEHW